MSPPGDVITVHLKLVRLFISGAWLEIWSNQLHQPGYMKEKLRPGPAFQQGGNNARKVGNKRLIVLRPALGDTKNIRDGLWALLRVSPQAVTHLWSSGRQRPPVYPHGSLRGRWRFPDHWLTLSLSSAGSPLFHIWCHTWRQRGTATSSRATSQVWFHKTVKINSNHAFILIK